MHAAGGMICNSRTRRSDVIVIVIAWGSGCRGQKVILRETLPPYMPYLLYLKGNYV